MIFENLPCCLQKINKIPFIQSTFLRLVLLLVGSNGPDFFHGVHNTNVVIDEVEQTTKAGGWQQVEQAKGNFWNDISKDDWSNVIDNDGFEAPKNRTTTIKLHKENICKDTAFEITLIGGMIKIKW
jgi:hypothetical protein